MRRSHAILAATNVSLAALCGGVPHRAMGQGHVTIVEYANPTRTVPLGRSAMRVDIGGGDSVEFHRIAAILPRGDGTFVVVNAGSHEVRFFDATGRLVSTTGRRGSGPGEYLDMYGAALLPGDSIAILDRRARRISVLDPRGGFVRSFSLAAPFEGGGSLTFLVAMRNGTMLIGHSEVQRGSPADRRLLRAAGVPLFHGRGASLAGRPRIAGERALRAERSANHGWDRLLESPVRAHDDHPHGF